jgi:cytochrome P450 family 12
MENVIFYDIIFRQDQAWGDFRTKVNQIMMQPRNAKLYIPGIDQVAKDFIERYLFFTEQKFNIKTFYNFLSYRMRAMRDKKNEMPENFWEKINEWALESIALIALDTRLGVINEGNDTNDGKRLNLVSILITSLSQMLLLSEAFL